MKRFVDDNGLFEIKVPITWRYSLQNKKVHTFQEHDIRRPDAFQLSINKLETNAEIQHQQRLVNGLPTVKLGNYVYYCYPDTGDKQFTTKAWTTVIDDKVVLFTLTYPNQVDKDLDERTIEDKINITHSVIKEFRLIEEGKNQGAINSFRFDMFLQGVGATSLILNKAVENKAFIEATCILANQIDAMLRIAIVLKKQLLNHNMEIETEWIYQGPKDKKKSEKDIYKKSMELGIIDQVIFDELYTLYENRNRVIHRFIISEITLAEVEEIAFRYYQKQEAIHKIVYDLESEQIESGIGMTIVGTESQVEQVNHLEHLKGKIGKLDYFESEEDKDE